MSNPPPLPPSTFTDTLASLLRLPDETLAIAYIYLHKHARFHRSSSSPCPLDPYTLSLSTLSLAAKATEAPRPPSAILLPAHRLLHQPGHPPNPAAPPLTTASATYPPLRRTLLASEQHLLRSLAFTLRVPCPLTFLPRYFARALEPRATDPGRDTEHDYARWTREAKDEWGVVELMDTRLGRRVREWGLRACRSEQVVAWWPSRAVAAGCVWVAVREAGFGAEEGDGEEWVERVGGGKVDVGEWREVVGLLERLGR
ncbi:hypothetical protein MMC27_008178 [Xylographa pallens]|nr:hypothetical protein [Xylographa pallens]